MSIISYLIIIAILLCVVIFCFKMIRMTSKAKKQGKQVRQNKINQLSSQLDAEFFHVIGLPLPEKTYCHLYLCDKKVVIEANGTTFNLFNNKIVNVTLKTDKEIEKAYVSSAGGAVGGALLFGPLGALIGGRVKEKKKTKTTAYIVFTYEKDTGIDYIAFDIGVSSLKAIKVVEYFNKNNTNLQKEINL